MKTSLKLLLTLSVAAAINSHAMWIGKPLLKAFAKRSIVSKVQAARPSVRQFVCRNTVAACAKSRQAGIVFRSKRLSSFTSKAKPNYKRISFAPSSIKYLAGASVALGVSYATASCEGNKESGKKSVAQYQAPFEASRKKFYGDLESKPWGEVSKKYIKALQEEEQKLMDEFFEITGLSKEQWNKVLIDNKSNYEKAIKQYGLTDFHNQIIPSSLKKLFEDCALLCSIDQKKLRFFQCDETDVMSALHSNVIVNSRIVNMYAYAAHPTTDSVVKCITLHELQHILHNDAHIVFSMRKLIDLGHVPESKALKYNNLKTKHRKFVERRADLLSFLTGSSESGTFRLALNYFTPTLDIIFGFMKTSSENHLKDYERVNYIDQLDKEMEEAIGKNKNK